MMNSDSPAPTDKTTADPSALSRNGLSRNGLPVNAGPAARRIAWLDAARGIALIAMAIYHFTWDLDFFGYIAPGTAATGGWRIFARLIAGSFIFLAGFSLVLGHFTQIRWRPFWIRFAKIAAAALVITVATYVIFPSSFIFFGILHLIAAASLLGLAFLRLPVIVILLCAAAALAAPHFLRSTLFDLPALWWVGLSQTVPHSNDYVPLLPWFGAFLLGMAAARLYRARARTASLAQDRLSGSRAVSLLGLAGRHSLPVYLLHQPLLIGLVYLMTQVAPPPRPDPVESYRQSCVAACSADTDAAFCAAFCGCTIDQLLERNLFDALNQGTVNLQTDARIAEISQQCTAAAFSGRNEPGGSDPGATELPE